LVAEVQRITWAYLRSGLFPDDPAWRIIADELTTAPNPPGKLACK